MPFIVHSPNSDAFHKAVPDQADCYLVGGLGDNVVLIPWADGPETDEAYARYMAIWRGKPCGCVGLSPEGHIVVLFDKGERDELAMETAALALARMEPAAARRAKSGAVVEWLESLFALEDTRPESGAAHA